MNRNKWIHLWTALTLILSFITFFVSTASAQDIHVLMVIDNGHPKTGGRHAIDRDTIESYMKSRVALMLRKERLDATVNIDKLLSNDDQATKENIFGWMQNLNAGADDVVFIYFSGSGSADKTGAYNQYFFIHKREKLYRNEIGKAMVALNCRLKILITEVDSVGPQVTEPMDLANPSTDVSTPATITEAELLKQLFLEHDGFLNLTAATEGEGSLGNHIVGGWFTNALVEAIFALPDVDGDGFGSWEEVFKETRRLTQEYFAANMDTFPKSLKDRLARIGQTTQRPKYYGELPRRIKR